MKGLRDPAPDRKGMKDLIDEAKIARAFEAAGIDLNGPAFLDRGYSTPEQHPTELPQWAGNLSGRFGRYLELLLRWNERMNLTAVREPEAIIARHFIECSAAALKLPPDTATLLDYGSGAGFPGIPIALLRPEIRVTLAESQFKKAAFLEEALRVVDLRCEVFARRVDTLPKERVFDAITLRAVDKMKLALAAALPRVKRYLVLFTTAQARSSLEELAPGFRWESYPLPPYTTNSILLLGRKASFHVEHPSLL